MLSIVLSGQKTFGKRVLAQLISAGHRVLAVVVPTDDRTLLPYALLQGIRIIPAGTLTAESMPPGADLGICAHSFDYIGKRTRYMPRLGWLGYHPSLLPRHRGRSAIEWALRMHDCVTGGTWYWLDHGIDRGDIAYQDWFHLDHRLTAKQVWDGRMQPLGLKLLQQALADIAAGRILRLPQRELAEFSTFEPGLDQVRDVYRPDLLMLPAPRRSSLCSDIPAVSSPCPPEGPQRRRSAFDSWKDQRALLQQQLDDIGSRPFFGAINPSPSPRPDQLIALEVEKVCLRVLRDYLGRESGPRDWDNCRRAVSKDFPGAFLIACGGDVLGEVKITSSPGGATVTFTPGNRFTGPGISDQAATYGKESR